MSAPGAFTAVVALVATGCGIGDGPLDQAACPEREVDAPVPDGYRGVLFDSHVRLDDAEIPQRLACEMDRHRVEGAALSTVMDPDDVRSSEEAYRMAVAGVERHFVPFFHPGAQQRPDMAAERLERVVARVGLFFRGIGEVDFQREPWVEASLEDDPWPEVFDFAAQRDLFVVLRLRGGQAVELERMLARHPGTKVLLRGPELRPALPELLATHGQLAYMLDAASLLWPSAYGVGPPAPPLLSATDGPDAFASAFDAVSPRIRDPAVAEWLPVIEAAPDRVVWGSGVHAVWHTEPGVYARLVAFSRAFMAELPDASRSGYAVGNARRLFGLPVPDQPDA